MKWMPYDGYVGPLGVGVRPIQCIEKNAEQIAERHNADIEALTAERDALARRINPDGAPVDVAALCLEIDETTAERDELQRRLNELLAILEPGPEPNCMDPQYNPSKRVSIYDVVRMWHEHRSSIHARALEIAGRTE